ncbi:unnamed protein product [Euphydryas editha]|uniref:Uncharacterized protein n=1 Tax=Euphydryas editha TaxID=104508 RepID=A0AAU9V6I6_EUPED|nr:unnamed protein product [Euphydryas editha]
MSRRLCERVEEYARKLESVRASQRVFERVEKCASESENERVPLQRTAGGAAGSQPKHPCTRHIAAEPCLRSPTATSRTATYRLTRLISL